jgi:tellurite resistance protein
MKKRIVKTTLAVAVVAASAIIGYASYTQKQTVGILQSSNGGKH